MAGRWVGWVLGAVAIGIAGCNPHVPEDASDATPFVLEVPRGTTPGGLGRILGDAGLVSGDAQWRWFRLTHDASCIKAGRFELRRSMSLGDVVDVLCGAPLPDDVPFTVVEGWRIRDIDRALADRGLIAAGAYAAVATSKGVDLPFPVEGATLEGYLYPETYRVPASGVDVRVLVGRQLDTFHDRWLALHEGGFGDRSLADIVTVASMLEREEPNPANRPLVAGIMFARLDGRTPLGIDATSRYTLDDWNDEKAFLRQLRDPKEPYNTRKKRGLPPTPIGNPSVASLDAAIAAQPSEFLYYLHDHDGTLHPARTLAEHEANRRRYRVW